MGSETARDVTVPAVSTNPNWPGIFITRAGIQPATHPKKGKHMTAAAFKIVTVKRPVSGQTIGYRMVLAHVNQAAFVPNPEGGGEYTQSFAPCYRITESGDRRISDITPEVQRSFLERAMKWHKIDSLHLYG